MQYLWHTANMLLFRSLMFQRRTHYITTTYLYLELHAVMNMINNKLLLVFNILTLHSDYMHIICIRLILIIIII